MKVSVDRLWEQLRNEDELVAGPHHMQPRSPEKGDTGKKLDLFTHYIKKLGVSPYII